MASLQFKAFRERFDDLVKGVQGDLHGIASRAYAKKLITWEALQTVTNQQNDIAQRSMSLVSSVHTSIGVSEDNFAAFVAILKAEPAVSGLADTLERTLYGLREGPRMEGKVAGSSTAGVGGATAMDLDSGVADADTSALSEATNGDMMLPEAELVSLRNSSPPPDQSEGGADQSDYDSRQRNSTFRQEVGQGGGADALVTTPHDRMPRVGPSASLDDKYNTRMELAQKDAKISVLEPQVVDLTKRLEDAEREYQKVDREKTEVAAELRNKEAEFQKVTKKKDKEIQHLKKEVESKEKQISEYQQQIAELERESTRAKAENEKTKEDYEERLKQLQQSLEEAQENLKQQDVKYHKELRLWEQKIYELKLQVSDKNTEMERMNAKIANYKAEVAEMRQKEADEKRQQAEEKQQAMEERLREEQEKRQNSEAEAEKKRLDSEAKAEKKRLDSEAEAEKRLREEQKKRRDSEAELGELRAKLAQLGMAPKMPHLPEDDADSCM